MPWGVVSAGDLRGGFVKLAGAEGANAGSLCRRFAISAKTGYKWLERYGEEGAAGLADRSRRPQNRPQRSSAEMAAQVLALREAHPAWGGRKIVAALERRGIAAPSASTVTAILQRHGVALGQFGGGTPAFMRFEHAHANDLWQMDFKGHVAMREGRLRPLRVLDDHSRFALVVAACANETTATVKEPLSAAFRRYGLPLCIMTDNGSPWGDGPGSPFTPLGVFLIEQGIRMGHSAPYHPQTMGKDERFHRSMKAEALSGPPFADLAHAARTLEHWRQIYNTERPHEALNIAVPIERYHPSPRQFREAVDRFDYATSDIIRRVQMRGWVSFSGCAWRVPKAFRRKDIAFRPAATDGAWEIWFRHQIIKTVNLNTT